MLKRFLTVVFIVWSLFLLQDCQIAVKNSIPEGQMYSVKSIAFLKDCAEIKKDLFSQYDYAYLLKTNHLDSLRIRLANDFMSITRETIKQDSVYVPNLQMIELLFAINKGVAAKQNHESTIEKIETNIKEWRWLLKYISIESSGSVILDMVLPKHKNDCEYMSRAMATVLNELGVITFCEYTPLWQDRARSHFWCAATDSLGVWQPFTPPDNNLREDWDSDLKYVGKVYRLESKNNLSILLMR